MRAAGALCRFRVETSWRGSNVKFPGLVKTLGSFETLIGIFSQSAGANLGTLGQPCEFQISGGLKRTADEAMPIRISVPTEMPPGPGPSPPLPPPPPPPPPGPAPAQTRKMELGVCSRSVAVDLGEKDWGGRARRKLDPTIAGHGSVPLDDGGVAGRGGAGCPDAFEKGYSK